MSSNSKKKSRTSAKMLCQHCTGFNVFYTVVTLAKHLQQDHRITTANAEVEAQNIMDLTRDGTPPLSPINVKSMEESISRYGLVPTLRKMGYVVSDLASAASAQAPQLNPHLEELDDLLKQLQSSDFAESETEPETQLEKANVHTYLEGKYGKLTDEQQKLLQRLTKQLHSSLGCKILNEGSSKFYHVLCRNWVLFLIHQGETSDLKTPALNTNLLELFIRDVAACTTTATISYNKLLYVLLEAAAEPGSPEYLRAKHRMKQLHKEITLPRLQRAARERHELLQSKFPDFSGTLKSINLLYNSPEALESAKSRLQYALDNSEDLVAVNLAMRTVVARLTVASCNRAGNVGGLTVDDVGNKMQVGDMICIPLSKHKTAGHHQVYLCLSYEEIPLLTMAMKLTQVIEPKSNMVFLSASGERIRKSEFIFKEFKEKFNTPLRSNDIRHISVTLAYNNMLQGVDGKVHSRLLAHSQGTASKKYLEVNASVLAEAFKTYRSAIANL